MESLRENRPLLISILVSTGLVLFLSLNLSSELTETFQIVSFPEDVSTFKNIATTDKIELNDII